MVSSKHHSTNNHEIISNDESRLCYIRLMSLTRKFHSVNSKKVFLQDCLRTDSIPKSFEISNLPQNHSSRFVAKRSHTKKQTSKQLIKIVVNQERTTEKHILFKTEKLKDELFLLNPEESW